jgi:hypothetical protein
MWTRRKVDHYYYSIKLDFKVGPRPVNMDLLATRCTCSLGQCSVLSQRGGSDCGECVCGPRSKIWPPRPRGQAPAEKPNPVLLPNAWPGFAFFLSSALHRTTHSMIVVLTNLFKFAVLLLLLSGTFNPASAQFWDVDDPRSWIGFVTVTGSKWSASAAPASANGSSWTPPSPCFLISETTLVSTVR